MMPEKLPKELLADLARSGLTPQDAKRLRIEFVPKAETQKLAGRAVNAYRLPYFELTGKPNCAMRLRFLGNPLPTDARGKPQRYFQPPKSGNRFYLPPLVGWAKIAADPSATVVITEGEKKAAAACKASIPCVGLGGVWSWRTRVAGVSQPLPDFDLFTWAGRPVELAFDSDIRDKPEVQAALAALATELRRRGATVKQVLLLSADGQKIGLDDFLVKHDAKAFRELPREEVQLVLDAADPLRTAQTFIADRYADGEARVLHHHRGDFFSWTGSHFALFEEQALRAAFYTWAERTLVRDTKGGLWPFKPSTTKVNNFFDALRASAHLPSENKAPCWLGDRAEPPSAELIACRNGLLHLPTRKLHSHTPAFFNVNSLPFDYLANAPAPRSWLKFLNDLWPKDREAIETLQEIFGYALTRDTRQQKLFLIVGPKRGGKGTIARVLTALLGRDNVCNPTLASLTSNFGLAPLIDKQLAIIGDARLSSHVDQHVIAERLLNISGEDDQSVDRKYREVWNGKLDARFLIMTNELPRLADASGALPSRFITLTLQRSFFGEEDHGLIGKLLQELPGILNWSLDGWQRLTKRGHFKPPRSSQDAVQELEDLASPISKFIRECCTVGGTARVSIHDLYTAWTDWCQKHGRTYPGTQETFGRDMRTVVPTLRREHPRINGVRVWSYAGVGLMPAARGGAASKKGGKF